MIDGSSRARIAVTLGVSSPSWVKVTGKVTGMEAAATKPEAIVLMTPALGEPITATIESDGSFNIPMAWPGTYQVRFMPLLDSFARSVTVGDAPVNQVTVSLVIPSFKVSGRVNDLTGFLPASGADSVYEARLRPAGQGRPTLGRSPAHLVVPIESDGTFAFRTVPAGGYQLEVANCTYFGTAPPTTPGTGGAGGGGGGCRSRVTNVVVTVTDKDIIGLVVSK
jgi:hypothetical protein